MKVSDKAALQKLGEPMAQELIKQYAAEQSPLNKILTMQANRQPTGLVDEAGNPITLMPKEAQAAKDFRQSVFGEGRSNPDVRSNFGKLQRATQAVNLIKAIPEGKPNPGEMSNIATAVAGLVQNGNLVTDAKMREILPRNVELSVAGIKQFLTSEPQGAEQTKFLNRFKNEIDSEVNGARNTLHKWIDTHGDSVAGTFNDKVRQNIQGAAHRFIDEGYYNPSTAKIRKQVNTKTGAVRWVDEKGNPAEAPK
jgi:hypothetical protein